MVQVVIVESPAKAKTINKYLGKEFKVLASFGHVRDLPSKDGSVLPDNDFEMIYEISQNSVKHIAEITKAVKDSTGVLLATDPDREGEAISWHLLEILKQKKAINKSTKVGRVVFNEITKKAVTDGVAKPRDLDMNLINAQQARRALDYLVGFNLSPILWRKLPGSKSAGRVQSVALRLICERDEEIERFVSREYWDIAAIFKNKEGKEFSARLTHFDGKKLEQFSFTNSDDAIGAVNQLKGGAYSVGKIEEKQSRRNPYAPFTTSTLQQEASRKLGMSTNRTMSVAQKLYEGIDIGGETTGLITYMRTDGVYISADAINAARTLIGDKFGANFVPKAPRIYKAKAKNAQEAHEAIRPTDVMREPESVKKYLSDDEYKLYDLIWKRTVASQMESAIYDQVAADISDASGKATFRANGSVIKFAGFLKLYQEGKDASENSNDAADDDENSKILPPLKTGDVVENKEITPNQHFTQPPPRYTEASIVKKMEELGIGRPSTYSSIISTLINRNYVVLEKRAFKAEERGRVVSAFLINFFRQYVEYDFTAGLEEKLDEVSAGDMEWKKLLGDFWKVFSATIEEVKPLKQTEVIDKVEAALENHIFPITDEDKEPRKCKACADGRLSLKMGKFGAFIGCSNYPECRFTRELIKGDESDASGAESANGLPKELGNDPATGLPIFVKVGPYGPYVEMALPVVEEAAEKPKTRAKKGEKKEAAAKPKRVSLPKGIDPMTLPLDRAIALINLPREVGIHPEDGKKITTGIGRFGPYMLHNTKYISLQTLEDVLEIGINRAVDLIAAKAAGGKGTGSRPEGKVLGNHPSGGEIQLLKGRYGPYLKHGKNNYKIPKGVDPDGIELDAALAIVGVQVEEVAEKPAAKAKKKRG